ncbi:hypothetical protein DEIPH_ctg045orf0007 [Deinococcus phoenicis]|uniref:Uncharacterized protein n=1 Tax=Deinococcus phoenicis TaxID=1476583 RepID=A0A016QMH5_9DEIO|nr:hypothetical protein [Deinococcus phoenicis]EYB67278.1 hypothetical protein DEIPH_ctg045orf0007 [Deinococcus phoenicis]
MNELTAEQIRELLEGATPGVWEVEPDTDIWWLITRRGRPATLSLAEGIDRADAHLMAASPTLAHTALSALARAEAAERRSALLEYDNDGHQQYLAALLSDLPEGNARDRLARLLAAWGQEPGQSAYVPRGELDAALERERGLREELAWYGEQARLCRLIHSEGDAGRHALAADGGQRARIALAPAQAGETDAAGRGET